MASANGTQCWKALVSLLPLPLERLPSGTVMGRAHGRAHGSPARVRRWLGRAAGSVGMMVPGHENCHCWGWIHWKIPSTTRTYNSTESQNGWAATSRPNHAQGHLSLDQVAQSPFHPAPELFQQWGIHSSLSISLRPNPMEARGMC